MSDVVRHLERRHPDAVALVKSTEPAWRIDVLEAIQDYLEDPDD